MSNNLPQSESWREALKFIGHCPLCDARYATEKAQAFLKQDTLNLIHLTCAECKSGFIAMVIVMGQGLSSVGMVTDLTCADAKRLFKTETITIDEVIEGHKFINSNSFLIE